MTFQEAHIACSDCFMYRENKDDIHFTIAEYEKIIMDCRTRATSALHHIYGDSDGKVYDDSQKGIAKKALTACARCDFKSPRIKDLVNGQF